MIFAVIAAMIDAGGSPALLAIVHSLTTASPAAQYNASWLAAPKRVMFANIARACEARVRVVLVTVHGGNRKPSATKALRRECGH